MTRLQRWDRIRGLVISWPKSKWAKDIKKRGSQRILKVALSEMTGTRSTAGVNGRMTRRRVRGRRKAAVGVGRDGIDDIDIARGMKNDINTDQGVETGTDMGADTKREKSGEIEVEARIEGKGGIGVGAPTDEDMKGRIAS